MIADNAFRFEFGYSDLERPGAPLSLGMMQPGLFGLLDTPPQLRLFMLSAGPADPLKRRSPRGIAAAAGEPYLGHSVSSVVRRPRPGYDLGEGPGTVPAQPPRGQAKPPGFRFCRALAPAAVPPVRLRVQRQLLQRLPSLCP